MKKGILALLIIGACWGAPLQAQDWENATLAEVQKAAELGDAEAQFSLGRRYDTAQGVALDDKQAVAWYRKAAEQGHANAQYYLGTFYYLGNFVGVPQDYKQAAVWYRKAAEQGHASAQSSLGSMYEKGDGVPQDYKQALAWIRKAAEQGNSTAQFSLGTSYAFGNRGGTQDYKQAYAWYSVAAANGFPSFAQKARDDMAAKLTPAALAEAQALAGQYFEKYQPKQ